MLDVKINGISLRKLGLRIEKRPSIPITKFKYNVQNREGYNGDIYSRTGADDRTIKLGFTIVSKSNIENISMEITRLLSEAETLIFTNNEDVYYKVKQVKSEDVEVSLKRIGRFNTEFTVAPFAYLKSGAEKIVLTEKGNIRNLGNTEAESVITIFGNGDINLVIAQQVMRLKGINQSITLDTNLLEAYKGAELQNRKANGEFPILPLGEFSISWSGNVSKVEIIPNWRCL